MPSHYNLSIPGRVTITDHLLNGGEIEIRGSQKSGYGRFSIQLDGAFHPVLKFEFEHDGLRISTGNGHGEWKQTDIFNNPMRFDNNFHIYIDVNYGTFTIRVNEKHLGSFHHSFTDDRIVHSIYVQGNVNVDMIKSNAKDSIKVFSPTSPLLGQSAFTPGYAKSPVASSYFSSSSAPHFTYSPTVKSSSSQFVYSPPAKRYHSIYMEQALARTPNTHSVSHYRSSSVPRNFDFSSSRYNSADRNYLSDLDTSYQKSSIALSPSRYNSSYLSSVDLPTYRKPIIKTDILQSRLSSPLRSGILRRSVIRKSVRFSSRTEEHTIT